MRLIDARFLNSRWELDPLLRSSDQSGTRSWGGATSALVLGLLALASLLFLALLILALAMPASARTLRTECALRMQLAHALPKEAGQSDAAIRCGARSRSLTRDPLSANSP